MHGKISPFVGSMLSGEDEEENDDADENSLLKGDNHRMGKRIRLLAKVMVRRIFKNGATTAIY